MIKKERFSEITKEVNLLINTTLDQLRIKSPEDYVLFIASGEFNEIIARKENSDFSPYTISYHNLENYYDYTRQHFLYEFWNMYYRFDDKKELEDDGYRMNIEFLIYTHIWEAKPFLKRLYRLVNLICGNEYDWKIKIPEFGKSDFIKTKIIEPFSSTNLSLSEILSSNYNSDLRNSIAHSDYQIDIDSKLIHYKSKKEICNTTFDDWNVHFAYSFCLSYYFSQIVVERRRRIIQDWGKNCFTIKRPSSDGTIQHVYIQYNIYTDDFGFIF